MKKKIHNNNQLPAFHRIHKIGLKHEHLHEAKNSSDNTV